MFGTRSFLSPGNMSWPAFILSFKQDPSAGIYLSVMFTYVMQALAIDKSSHRPWVKLLGASGSLLYGLITGPQCLSSRKAEDHLEPMKGP